MKKRTEPAVEERLRKWQVRTFAVCWTAYFITYLGRTNLSVALSALSARFESGNAAVGFLGSLFFWVYAVGKLLNGYRGDRTDNRRQIFIGLFVSGLCNIGVAFAGKLWMVMLLWAVNGFAQSALWCNILNLSAHWFYPQQYSGVVVWMNTSMVGGALAGWGVCGWLIQRMDWQWVFLVPGMVLTGFAVCWLLLIKSSAADVGFPDVSAPAKPQQQGTADLPALRALWRKAGLLYMVVACLAQGVVKDGIGLWGPEMVGSSYGMDTGSASFFLLFIPVMNFIGILLAGKLQSRLRLSDTSVSAMLMIAAIVSIGGLQLTMGRSLMGGVFWLGMASAVMHGVNTIILCVFPMRFAADHRIGFVSGLLDFTSYMAAGLSSVFSGWILDRGKSWGIVFMVWQALTLLGLLALFRVHRRHRPDVPPAENA